MTGPSVMDTIFWSLFLNRFCQRWWGRADDFWLKRTLMDIKARLLERLAAAGPITPKAFAAQQSEFYTDILTANGADEKKIRSFIANYRATVLANEKKTSNASRTLELVAAQPATDEDEIHSNDFFEDLMGSGSIDNVRSGTNENPQYSTEKAKVVDQHAPANANHLPPNRDNRVLKFEKHHQTTGYNVLQKEVGARLKGSGELKNKQGPEVMKILSDGLKEWTDLSEDDKRTYLEEAQNRHSNTMRIVNPQQRLKLQEKEFSKMEKGQDNLDLLEVDSILFTFDRRPESKGVRVSTRGIEGQLQRLCMSSGKKPIISGTTSSLHIKVSTNRMLTSPRTGAKDGTSFTKGGKPKSNVFSKNFHRRTEVKDMVLGKINMERARADLSALMTYPTKGLLDGSACIHFSGVPNGMNMAKWVQWTKLELDELNAAIQSGNFRVTLGSNNNLMDLWEALCVGDVLEDQTQLQTNGPSIALNFVKGKSFLKAVASVLHLPKPFKNVVATTAMKTLAMHTVAPFVGGICCSIMEFAVARSHTVDQ
ncbi:hypothetical protein DFJ73DRAFT_923154 [Zopfochytrium polystomum]|nr:hypothetical protein DFJ73DRAFT_923154 [Zopfochytrium polystomum]